MIKGFQGYVRQGVARSFFLVLSEDDGSIAEPDQLPTFRIYGANGFVLNGTCAYAETGTITGATNASPIVITDVSHGLTTGANITITGVLGNTAANADWRITYLTADTFSLDGSVGNGAYTSGGTWTTLALFTVSLSIADTQNFTPGESYTVVISYTVGGNPRSVEFTFGVN